MTRLAAPSVILFDWHATLVDTLDAMYKAVDDMLGRLDDLDLQWRLVDPGASKTDDDARLVRYVRRFKRLHPKIREARKISRTDIFEVLFGADAEAKHIAHVAFNHCYRDYFGEVYPFEDGVREMLEGLRRRSLRIGLLTNRDREFLEHEISVIEGTGWTHLFDATVCGDDTPVRKPAPDPIFMALTDLAVAPGPGVWYVGDSTTDTTAAKVAGVTSVFFNGAGWDPEWIDKIFPGTERYPHRPDARIDTFAELTVLVDSACGAAAAPSERD